MLGRVTSYQVHVPSADWSADQCGLARASVFDADAVDRFEDAVAAFLGAEFTSAGSARTCLYLLLRVLSDGAGRLLVPAFTCVAVPNAAIAAGVRVEWIDVEGLHMDAGQAAPIIRRSDVLLDQHTFGLPPKSVASAPFVIEDRAHRFDMEDVRGDAVIFSLEHSKVFSAGNGGLVWVRDPKLRARLRAARDELPMPTERQMARVLRTTTTQLSLARGGLSAGIKPLLRRFALRLPPVSSEAQSREEMEGAGIRASQLHPLCATIASAGLKHLGADLGHRLRLVDVYRRVLGSLVPETARDYPPVVRMPVQVDDAERVRRAVREAGIDLGRPWFSAPVHPPGSRSTYVMGSAPVAESLCRSILNLPLHRLVSADDARRIAAAVARVA
jgi:dTDP-4-amino-4,6-dideoxygalactose transaminase